jgi:hypothetical protein
MERAKPAGGYKIIFKDKPWHGIRRHSAHSDQVNSLTVIRFIPNKIGIPGIARLASNQRIMIVLMQLGITVDVHSAHSMLAIGSVRWIATFSMHTCRFGSVCAVTIGEMILVPTSSTYANLR